MLLLELVFSPVAGSGCAYSWINQNDTLETICDLLSISGSPGEYTLLNKYLLAAPMFVILWFTKWTGLGILSITIWNRGSFINNHRATLMQLNSIYECASHARGSAGEEEEDGLNTDFVSSILTSAGQCVPCVTLTSLLWHNLKVISVPYRKQAEVTASQTLDMVSIQGLPK